MTLKYEVNEQTNLIKDKLVISREVSIILRDDNLNQIDLFHSYQEREKPINSQ